jgi:putative SOS response-associated peptidase YedK
LWLDSPSHALLKPYPAERMKTVAVNSRVNNSRDEGTRCLEPA